MSQMKHVKSSGPLFKANGGVLGSNAAFPNHLVTVALRTMLAVLSRVRVLLLLNVIFYVNTLNVF